MGWRPSAPWRHNLGGNGLAPFSAMAAYRLNAGRRGRERGRGLAATYSPLNLFSFPAPSVGPLPIGVGHIPSSLSHLPLLPPLGTAAPILTIPSTSRPTTAVTLVMAPAISASRADTGRPPAFSLASSFPPVPAKLVSRIQGLEFVEMRELLPDNIALSECLEALPGAARFSNTPQREIASISTWTCAFATYVAIVSQAHPNRARDMLAYMRLVVREAQTYGTGVGWLTYDSVYRQNNQGAHCRWDTLDASLHTAYIGGQGIPTVPPCRHYRGVDHSSDECALSPVVPAVRPGAPMRVELALGERKGRQLNPKQTGGFICRSWNWGKCRYPGTCYYRHVCSACGEQHMVKDCQRTAMEEARRTQARRGDGQH